MAKFEKLKLPSYGQMGGVAFHDSDLQLAASGARVVLFGGQRQGLSNALYSFEQSAGEGWMLMPEGAEGAGPPPGPRTQCTYTSVGVEPQSTLIMFAGFVMNNGCQNDLWRCVVELDALSMPVPVWTLLEAAGEAPCPRYGHSATNLEKLGKIIFFGGQDGKTQYNDVFVLDHAAPAWSSPSVSGTPPSVRVKHSANAISPTGIMVFGGFNRDNDVRTTSDAFKLEVGGGGASVAWSGLKLQAPAGSKSIPPRAQHATAITDDNKFAIIYGGYDGAKSLNDLWVCDLASMSLRQIEVERPQPEARSRHTMHIIGGLLHVFGGYNEGKPCEGNVFTLDVSDPGGMESVGDAEGGDKKDKKKKEQEEKPEDEDD